MRGFQRRVWWPKWTPASRSWRRVNSGIAIGVSFPLVRLVLRGARAMQAPDPKLRERRPACELPAARNRDRGPPAGGDMAETPRKGKTGQGPHQGDRIGPRGGCGRLPSWRAKAGHPRLCDRVAGEVVDGQRSPAMTGGASRPNAITRGITQTERRRGWVRLAAARDRDRSAR